MEAKPEEASKEVPKVSKDDAVLGQQTPAIFSKVLKKQASDPASPNFQLKSRSLEKEEQEEEKQVSLLSRSSGASSSKAAVLPSPKAVEADEVAELHAWMKREPVVGPKTNKKGKKKGKAMKVAKVVNTKNMEKTCCISVFYKGQEAKNSSYLQDNFPSQGDQFSMEQG